VHSRLSPSFSTTYLSIFFLNNMSLLCKRCSSIWFILLKELYCVTANVFSYMVWILLVHFLKSHIIVGFEVLTVVVRSSDFWDIMLCSLLKANQCFRRTCCLHFQDQRISQARNQHEGGRKNSLLLFHGTHE
jgi:hypothetical protein